MASERPIQPSDAGYFMATDEEMSRLENQHSVIKDAMGGSLLLQPIDLSVGPLRILDSATADGMLQFGPPFFYFDPAIVILKSFEILPIFSRAASFRTNQRICTYRDLDS